MDLISQALLFIAVALAALTATGMLLPVLRTRAILDHPNDRSSHDVPTPKGGGIAVVGVVLTMWTGFGLYSGADIFITWVLPAAALALALLSWVDDLRGLPALVRLLSQIAIVAITLMLRPTAEPFFHGLLPPALDLIVAGLLWVWFINLFNFMDGIDGITGVEVVVIGLGIGLIGGEILGIILAAGAFGFLKWNWHPARVFMGDVGSVPLGFLLGWLLLGLASDGLWAAALILPSYYLADATVTLVRRGLRGEKVWQAHREHAYQKAVQRGLSHATVSGAVFCLGLGLIGLAWAAENGYPVPALVGMALLNLGFLRYLSGGKAS